jgi:hypothetical protein
MSSDDVITRLDHEEWASLGQYLVEHADRLVRDRALLDRLGLQPKAKTLIDFGPAALAKLEERAIKDLDARRRLEMTMRANFDAQSQAHALVLNLMEARNHADLARRLYAESRARFGLVAATIALEDTAPVPLGWKRLDEGGVDYIIGEQALSLLGPEGVCRVLFDDDVARIKSAAVMRIAIGREGREGLVAFGSGDLAGFTPDMGADLVAFVARVVERVAERWPILN